MAHRYPRSLALRALCALALCVAGTPALARMDIKVLEPTPMELAMGLPIDFYLSGPIDADAPRRLRQAFASTGNTWVSVYLNSPGGNLAAGIELGRILRKSGATVWVGIPRSAETTSPGQPPAICFSACSLTLLGGEFRYAQERTHYGMHRAFKDGVHQGDLDFGQIVAATIAAYIREMDADPALLDLMVRAGRDGMYILSPEEMKRYRVINNGRKKPEWTIEVAKGGMYLRGFQDSLYGSGKAMIICTGKEFGLVSIHHMGDRAEQVARGGWVHSLMVDKDTIPLQPPRRLENKGGEINASFNLSRTAMQRLQAAKSIGHAMQTSYDAPTFIGYSVDVDEASQDKVGTFLDNCLR